MPRRPKRRQRRQAADSDGEEGLLEAVLQREGARKRGGGGKGRARSAPALALLEPEGRISRNDFITALHACPNLIGARGRLWLADGGALLLCLRCSSARRLPRPPFQCQPPSPPHPRADAVLRPDGLRTVTLQCRDAANLAIALCARPSKIGEPWRAEAGRGSDGGFAGTDAEGQLGAGRRMACARAAARPCAFCPTLIASPHAPLPMLSAALAAVQAAVRDDPARRARSAAP